MTGHLSDWSGVWTAAFPAVLCLYVMITASIHILRSEARRPEDFRRVDLPSVAVLVPARNEAKVLEECLEALLESDHPSLEIHVLSDGSTDGTAEIARRYAGHGVRLHEHVENVGKSQVLEMALAGLTTDLVMVIDADTHLGPTAAREMAEVFARHPEVAGATANVRVKRAGNLLACLQVVEYASIIGLLKRANSAWGGLFTVSGAACCFRTDVVRGIGGFASPSITEDIELSWRLQKAGFKLVYVPRALVGVDVPHSVRDLWRQRLRWSQGLAEVLRLHGNVWRSRNPALRVFALEAGPGHDLGGSAHRAHGRGDSPLAGCSGFPRMESRLLAGDGSGPVFLSDGDGDALRWTLRPTVVALPAARAHLSILFCHHGASDQSARLDERFILI